MKAAIIREFGAGFTLEDVELSEPVGREVLIDVRACGLCHTDLTAATVDIGIPTPSLLGHEVSGVVTAIGPEVADFVNGDHVVGCLLQYCGACRKCLSGRVYQCRHPERTLRTTDQPPRITLNGAVVTQAFGLGGFAQQALVHESQLVHIDTAVPFPQAAVLGCGVVTGAGVVLNTAQVEPGSAVVIVGAGGVGLNAISGALIAGATTIVAIDIADDKLLTARAFGATDVINSRVTDPVAAVRAITDGGADAVFDFVGAPDVTRRALRMVATGGGLFLVGATDPEHGFELRTLATIGSQKRVQGVVMGSTMPRRDIPMYAKLYLEGRFRLDELISKEISLAEVNEGYEALREPRTNRVLVTDFR